MLNKLNLRFNETGSTLAGWLVDYISTHPLPRTAEATVIVAGGPSMMKADQLPANAYPGEAWQDVEFSFEPKPLDLAVASSGQAFKPDEEPEQLHRFQVNKFWRAPDETEARQMGIAWLVDITDTYPAYLTTILVDAAPYNLHYWGRLLSALAAKSLTGDWSGQVEVAEVTADA